MSLFCGSLVFVAISGSSRGSLACSLSWERLFAAKLIGGSLYGWLKQRTRSERPALERAQHRGC